MNLRAGIVASSGGSALAAAHQCIVEAGHSFEIVLATDRECGASEWARARGFDTRDFIFSDKASLSEALQIYFERSGCKDILLYFTRVLGTPFISKSRVSNIHPSLLPSFPGLHSVERARAARVRLLGATLHCVDEGIDTGAILAQVATSVEDGFSAKEWERLSYKQKVWLTLIWYERLAAEPRPQRRFVRDGSAATIGGPDLADPGLLRAFLRWERTIDLGL